MPNDSRAPAEVPSAVVNAHGRHAQAVTFTRSGRILVSGGQDAHVRLWSVPGFRPVGAIVGHKNSVNSVAFSPDEAFLLTSSSDGTVRVWTFPDGREVHVFEKQRAARYSPTGGMIATLTSKGTITLRDAADGATIREIPPIDRRVFDLQFAPDEGTLLIAGLGRIFRVSVATGDVESSIPAHHAGVFALQVSPDGTTLVSSGGPGAVRFWSVGDLTPRGGVSLETGGVLSLACAPSGAEVSVGVDYQVLAVSIAEPAIIARRRVGVKGVYGLAYSADGKYLANAAADGKVRVWKLA